MVFVHCNAAPASGTTCDNGNTADRQSERTGNSRKYIGSPRKMAWKLLQGWGSRKTSYSLKALHFWCELEPTRCQGCCRTMTPVASAGGSLVSVSIWEVSSTGSSTGGMWVPCRKLACFCFCFFFFSGNVWLSTFRIKPISSGNPTFHSSYEFCLFFWDSIYDRPLGSRMHRRHIVEDLEGTEMTVRENDLCFPGGGKLCTYFPRLPSCRLSQCLCSDTATAAFLLCCPGFFGLSAPEAVLPPRWTWAVSSTWPAQALGVQGQGRGLPGTSFRSRGFGSLPLAAGPQSGQPQTVALQSQGFRQALGACVPRGPEPCHEGGEGEVRLSLGWRWGWTGNMAASSGTCSVVWYGRQSYWCLDPGHSKTLGPNETVLLLITQCSTELLR